MSAIEMQTHLQQLEAERALALIEGLGNSAAYMADLNDEIAATRHAYVAAAVTEIAVLRASSPEGCWANPEEPMSPRFWTVTVAGQTLTVVAGTREAAEKIAAERIAARA